MNFQYSISRKYSIIRSVLVRKTSILQNFQQENSFYLSPKTEWKRYKTTHRDPLCPIDSDVEVYTVSFRTTTRILHIMFYPTDSCFYCHQLGGVNVRYFVSAQMLKLESESEKRKIKQDRNQDFLIR